MAGESASRLLVLGEYVGLSTEEMSGAMAKMSKTTMTAAVALETAARSGGKVRMFYKVGYKFWTVTAQIIG